MNVTPGVKGFISTPVAERFWAKVQKGVGCWQWQGAKRSRKQGRDYGIIYVSGKKRAAAQIAWELANDLPFPPGTLACHTCDNPPCVNPAHIFPGTHSDNQRDCANKGRHGTKTCPERLARGDRNGTHTHPDSVARGERQGSAKLTHDLVMFIRKRHAMGIAKKRIARALNISDATVYDIVKRRSWKHVSDD